uniref:Tetratricopeptide repeat protein 18-like n=2 Tax=Tetraselmis sp. GSL018 TaxID=582737 RepID=A0A061QN23_9CHLO|eukprot:CAMPEP_0177626072 /NCGR_PEP_ID=MMETSP0419_2-20121207/30454_1 /TAXON_ID=582737 /ORGANISM="Tetraselmis sp., Strain GSL018" /LENGTH=1074 /DNA_ID=CAMNT_0019127093 /DNA_START=169 /DNA_END=3393 /DNA_ORIENTATION=+
MTSKKKISQEEMPESAWQGPNLIFVVATATAIFPEPSPPEEGVEPQQRPQVYARLRFFEGPAAGVQSDLAQAQDDGSYVFNLSHRVTLPQSKATLEELLNFPVTVEIGTPVSEGKKAQNVDVAKAKLDLLGFALAEHTVRDEALPLELLAAPEGVEALDSATVSVCARLLQEAQGDDAGEAVPATLLSEEQAQRGRVVTMQVATHGPMPDGLEASTALAGPELSFRFGLRIPSAPAKALAELDPDDEPPEPRSLLLKQGALVKKTEGEEEEQRSCIEFADSGRRFYLSPDVVAALGEALEDRTQLILEMARALPTTAGLYADNAVDMFHGIARIDLSPLADPGAESASASVRFKKSFGETQAAGRVRRSVLGPLGPAEPPPKAKQLAEGVDPPPPPGAQPRPCSWAAAGTELSVSLTLIRSLFPPWGEPPKPTHTLQELVPRRNLEKIEEPHEAADDFRAEVRKSAKFLAAEYHSMFADEPELHDGSESEEKVMAARQRRVVFELNRTGKYLEIKERLRAIIVRVVQERYHKSGDMGYDEMQGLYNDLYVHLIDEMHRELNHLIHGPYKKPEEAVPDDAELARLQALADEYEVVSDVKRATQCHQERLLASSKVDVWYRYGCFLCRSGMTGQAVEALREAVAIDPDNIDALLALSSALWEEGSTQDIQFLERADCIVQAILEKSKENGCAWALLSLIYADIAAGASSASEEEGDLDARQTNARNARFKAMQLCQGNQAQGVLGIGSNFFLQLAIVLLDLKLGQCAAKALAEAVRVPRWEQIRVDVALCNSRAAYLLNQGDLAIKHARDAIRYGSSEDIRPLILMADVHFEAGRYAEAAASYQKALSLSPQSCSLDLYLRLATSFSKQGKMQLALDIYTQACAARPCASTWLGAGICAYRMGDPRAADLALAEANILNPHNPVVWGYLALVHLAQDHMTEADTAIKFAFKEEITEKELMLEIGGAYMERGMYHAAENVLRNSIKFADSSDLRAMLGDAMFEQNEIEGAVSEYLMVVQVDGQYSASRTDENAVHCLNQLKRCFESLGKEEELKEVDAYITELLRVEKWMESATIFK